MTENFRMNKRLEKELNDISEYLMFIFVSLSTVDIDIDKTRRILYSLSKESGIPTERIEELIKIYNNYKNLLNKNYGER
jgi:hypothetical protein